MAASIPSRCSSASQCRTRVSHPKKRGTHLSILRATTPTTRSVSVSDQPADALGRRGTLLSLLALSAAVQSCRPGVAAEDADKDAGAPVVTDRVFLDVAICQEGYKKDRRLGDATILCGEPEPMGQIVIDLYGEVAPDTTYNFKELIRSGALVGTVVNRCFERSFIVAGQQGAHRMGLLEVGGRDLVGKLDLRRNSDLLKGSSFKLRHVRPGTVSLNLSRNMDDDFYRNRAGYTELGFLVTTGPGPVPSLDEENIVFGRVSKGMDVVARISEVPTFKENKSLQVFTDLATVLGDDRVQKKQAVYGRPLKPVLFTRTVGIAGLERRSRARPDPLTRSTDYTLVRQGVIVDGMEA